VYKINKDLLEFYQKKINVKYVLENIINSIKLEIKKNTNTNTFTLIGCNIPTFKKWIDYQFDDNMNWENYGTYWNIDHVKPCSSFNLDDEKQQEECFIWFNMRPLKCTEKYNKIDQYIIDTHSKIYKQFLFLNSGNP